MSAISHALYGTIGVWGNEGAGGERSDLPPTRIRQRARKGLWANEMTPPDDNETVSTRQESEQRTRWYKPMRCSICASLIWLRPVTLEEPVGAPEPRRVWHLCKRCHKALLAEMSHSTIHSPIRLRIAMGLVAAERSPLALSTPAREQQQFRKEFSLAVWFLILFGVFHLVVFAILLAVPK